MKIRGNRTLHRLDSFLGGLILSLLGAMNMWHPKRKKVAIKELDTLVILKTGAIGDALLVGVVIDGIRQLYPDVKIYFICTRSNVEAVRGLSAVDRIIVFDLMRPLSEFIKLRSLPRFKLLIDFAPWARLNAIIAALLQADWKVGFRTSGMHRHYIYDSVFLHSSSRHELDNYRGLLRSVGIEVPFSEPKFVIDFQMIKSESFRPIGGETVIFHPYPGGSQKHLKSWPVSNWIELGKLLSSEGKVIVITGSESDRDAAQSLAAAIGSGAVSVAGDMTLNQTAYLISRSRLLVTVDTGIMHLGSAVKTNVVSLHGPTDPKRWGAIGKNVYPVHTKLKCSPCISLGFDSKCRDAECMKSIKVDEVYSIISSVFARNSMVQ